MAKLDSSGNRLGEMGITSHKRMESTEKYMKKVSTGSNSTKSLPKQPKGARNGPGLGKH